MADNSNIPEIFVKVEQVSDNEEALPEVPDSKVAEVKNEVKDKTPEKAIKEEVTLDIPFENTVDKESLRRPTTKTKRKKKEPPKLMYSRVGTVKKKIIDMPCERLEVPTASVNIIAKAWGVEYEQMRTDQQLYAKKAIDNVLFEGRMGTLHRYSVIINNNMVTKENERKNTADTI